jgi:hypothetical protein
LNRERKQQEFPVRSLHDFLIEINDEWNTFRSGSILSIATTLILFILFIPRYFLITLRQPGFVDTLIAIGIVAALVYNAYLAYRQYQFYSRWEKRMGLLLHIEEQLLGD